MPLTWGYPRDYMGSGLYYVDLPRFEANVDRDIAELLTENEQQESVWLEWLLIFEAIGNCRREYIGWQDCRQYTKDFREWMEGVE